MTQKLLRVFVIIATCAVTLGILVGATIAYRHVIYQNPLESTLSKLAAVDSFDVEKYSSHSKIQVQFKEQTKLRTNFYLLLDQLEGQPAQIVERLTVEINNEENEKLKLFLREAQLPVYEAISTGEYTHLTENLDGLSEKLGAQYILEIDNNFIFLTAFDGSNSAYLVISRGNSPIQVINTMGGEYL